MSLLIGDTAPDFEAETTQGPIRFHDWTDGSWAVLFSHPKDFTPVCTTELGYMAKLKPEFDRRGVKVIGLSVDATADHEAWARDIEETQGARLNFPIIADADFKVSKLYGMLPAEVSGDAKSRTPAQNQTVRNVFVIGADKKIKLILVYPMTTGRNFDGDPARDRLTPAHRQAPRLHSCQLEAGRRRGNCRLGQQRRSQADIRGLERTQALHTHRPPAELSRRSRTAQPNRAPQRRSTAQPQQKGAEMILTQHYLACLSQASYLIGDETTGRAVVVDPRRDVGVYLDEASSRGLRIETRHRNTYPCRLPERPPRTGCPDRCHHFVRGWRSGGLPCGPARGLPAALAWRSHPRGPCHTRPHSRVDLPGRVGTFWRRHALWRPHRGHPLRGGRGQARPSGVCAARPGRAGRRARSGRPVRRGARRALVPLIA